VGENRRKGTMRETRLAKGFYTKGKEKARANLIFFCDLKIF
jgi:hypothetical protein